MTILLTLFLNTPIAASMIAAGILWTFDFFQGFVRQLHPVPVALAMGMSGILVFTNSLRLYRAKINLNLNI